MPQLVSPGRLMGPRAGVIDNYVFNGLSAPLVADHAGVNNNGTPFYRKQGSTTTFSGLFSTRYDRSDMATMFNSSGNLVWSPHNLVDTPGTPVTQSITVISGADYTVKMLGTGSVTLSNAGTGTVTEGSPVTVTASTTTLTLTVSGTVDDMWSFRSDLGGMATVPADERAVSDQSDYVETTGSARFLPRREHHVFDGSSFVLGGMRQEPAATNLVGVNSSLELDEWSDFGANITTTADAVTRLGFDTWAEYADNNGGGSGVVGKQSGALTLASGNHCAWAVVERSRTNGDFYLEFANFTLSGAVVYFNASTGAVLSTSGAGYVDSGSVELADGLYLCYVVCNIDSGDVVGNIKLLVTNGTDVTPALDGTHGLYISMAQVEAGDFPTSFIPTNGASVTRATDVTAGQVLAADAPADTTAVFYAMHGRVSYADNAAVTEIDFYERRVDADNALLARLDTSGTNTGVIQGEQEAATVVDTADGNSELTPGVDVAFKFAVRHTSGAIQVANNGVAGAENSTPTALADLSTATLDLCGAFTGNVEMIVSGTGDPGSAGIVEAST